MKANLKKVLVVDDDPVVAKSFDRVLAGKGYAVITARDGNEALEKLRDERYDVVYTDIRMPGMDGVEVARHVKAAHPWTPVVIVTGYGTNENVERAWAAGVSGFLRKPLSPEMIEESALTAAHAEAKAEPAEAAAPAARGESAAKHLALMLAAPFLGLAFIVALPFIGAAALAWFLATKAFGEAAVHRALAGARDVALFIAAPFIGLAYVLIGPFVGVAALAWYGGKALLKRRER